MASNPPPPRTQEQSIRARKSELFDDEPIAGPSAGGPRRSFTDCLRETPAAPLSPAVKGLLWAVGVLVVLLLAVALITGGGRKKPPARAAVATAASGLA